MNQFAFIGIGSVALVSLAIFTQPGTKPGLDHPVPASAPQVPAPSQVQPDAPPPAPVPPSAPAPAGVRMISPQMVAAVVAGLKKSPGCLGADLGQLQSGKYVIFAWFESKKALVAWYESAEHDRMATMVWPERDRSRAPLADLPDDVGPIMAIAAASPPRPAEPGDSGPPSMRLAIEIYKPLPGGLRMGGGTFAPEGFNPGIRSIDVNEPSALQVPGGK